MNSVILKGKVVDRRNMVNALLIRPSTLSISFSWGGLGRSSDYLYCGQNKNEKTLHKLFEFLYELPPCGFVLFTDLDVAVREYANGNNIVSLPSNLFTSYLVTEKVIDISKSTAAGAKIRVVVEQPTAMLAFASGESNAQGRLIHIFYGDKEGGKADLSNSAGGGAAVNVSTFYSKTDNIGAMLQLRFDDRKGGLPDYVELFRYPNSLAMKAMLRTAAERIVESGSLNNISTGNPPLPSLFSDVIFHSRSSSFLSFFFCNHNRFTHGCCNTSNAHDAG